MKTAFQSLSGVDLALSLLAEKAGLFSLAITRISLRGVSPHGWEAQEPCLAFLPEPAQTCAVSCQRWGKPFPCGGVALHPGVWLCGSLSYRGQSLGLRQMRGSETAEGLCSWFSLGMATARAAPERERWAAGWATPPALPFACTGPQTSPFSPCPQEKHVVRTWRRRTCSADVSTGRQGHWPAGQQG